MYSNRAAAHVYLVSVDDLSYNIHHYCACYGCLSYLENSKQNLEECTVRMPIFSI